MHLTPDAIRVTVSSQNEFWWPVARYEFSVQNWIGVNFSFFAKVLFEIFTRKPGESGNVIAQNQKKNMDGINLKIIQITK